MKLRSKLENDLFELALQLGVGTKNSDTCLLAIRKIQELEGDIVDLTERAHPRSNY